MPLAFAEWTDPDEESKYKHYVVPIIHFTDDGQAIIVHKKRFIYVSVADLTWSKWE